MFLKWITSCLLFLTLIYLTYTDAVNDFRATEGETVYLPCHSPPIDSVQVSVEWTKHSTNSTTNLTVQTVQIVPNICQWIINNITGSLIGDCIPHFKFNNKSFTLSIENVQLSDSGHYSCKTTRVIPPPTLDNTTNVTLQVEVRPHLSLQKLNSSNVTCVHLLCSMEGLTTELVSFTWSREGQMLLHLFTSYATNSELRLCKPDWSDGDTITCYASYSDTQTKRSIHLPSQSDSDKVVQLLIISCSAAAGLILCIILTVVICKCRKQDENGSIVFSNKVYENFSFAMARQNTQSNDKPQPEECIYEN
ncbi:protein amalgam-like [Sinocyclocheilus anshuiensis]|uniref:protein amalgam-like n=1 Tax=Sinocyclocheilus anshuiensis TaxID=1608454 RepID=UPI0007B79B12|nr:PREDICTED: protein amalgam-like [Sinocyclocheilus anshuiensis]